MGRYVRCNTSTEYTHNLLRYNSLLTKDRNRGFTKPVYKHTDVVVFVLIKREALKINVYILLRVVRDREKVV